MVFAACVKCAFRFRDGVSGARVISYWFDASAPLYVLLVYAKNTRLDMTADERKEGRGALIGGGLGIGAAKVLGGYAQNRMMQQKYGKRFGRWM